MTFVLGFMCGAIVGGCIIALAYQWVDRYTEPDAGPPWLGRSCPPCDGKCEQGRSCPAK